jgi:Ca-activated chloride channel family protein
MRLPALFALIVLTLVSPVAVVAQVGAVNPPEQEVSVSAFITDVHGNTVTAIGDGDLSIEDNHKPPVTILGINHDDSPLHLGVLIDKSSSQRSSPLYKPAVEGLNEFLKRVLQQQDDRVFVQAFDSAPGQPTPWMSADEVQHATFRLQPSGGTSLFDAIEHACQERFATDASPARRVLLVLSDGEDDQSHVSLDAAIEAALKARVAIIAISTEFFQLRRGASILKSLTESTGGYAFLDSGQVGLPQAFSQIPNLLNSMFQVVYVPGQGAGNGKSHSLQISQASGRKLRIRAPRRYYPATH